jgi:hypothetical protein
MTCRIADREKGEIVSPRGFVHQRGKGSLKNNFTFYTPLHPARLRCESSEYQDIPAFSRFASRAPQPLKL